MGLFRSSSKDKGGKGKKSVAAPPPNILQSLKAAPNSQRPADFGSIRFQNSRRPLPSKYVRVSGSDMDSVGDLFGRHGLLMETWGLKPPCAIISVLNRAGALRIDRDHGAHRDNGDLIDHLVHLIGDRAEHRHYGDLYLPCHHQKNHNS